MLPNMKSLILNRLAVIGLGLAALTSCTNLNENSEWGNGSKVKFSSYIAGQKAVRASGTAWTNGDQVGIFMKQGATVKSANVKYVADDRGNLTAATASEALAYPSDNSAVDFVAYYPYAASAASGTYDVNVSNQSNLPAIDLLYANNATNKTAASGEVNLGFTHQLTQIVLNITTDATIPTTAGLSVTLNGTPATGKFDLNTGALTADAATANIAMNVNAAGTTATAIVLPAAATSGKLVFTLGGVTVEKALSVSTLGAGTKVVIPVKLTKGGSPSTMNVSFGSATIADWTEVAGGEVNVDFKQGEQPQPGNQEVVIFEETLGATPIAKGGKGWPYLKDFTGWSNPSLTFEDVNKNLSVRHHAGKNCIWFAANKDCDLHIGNIPSNGYKKFKLTYKVNGGVFKDGDTMNLNLLKGKFNDTTFTTPDKVVKAPEDKETYFEFTVELPANDTEALGDLHFQTNIPNGSFGMRLAEIKLVGIK